MHWLMIPLGIGFAMLALIIGGVIAYSTYQYLKKTDLPDRYDDPYDDYWLP